MQHSNLHWLVSEDGEISPLNLILSYGVGPETTEFAEWRVKGYKSSSKIISFFLLAVKEVILASKFSKYDMNDLERARGATLGW